MANRYGDAPYVKTSVATATWTQVSSDNHFRVRLVLHTRTGVVTFFVAFQRTEPVTTDVAEELVGGGITRFSAIDMPTSAIWVFQSSGSPVDFFVSEVTE